MVRSAIRILCAAVLTTTAFASSGSCDSTVKDGSLDKKVDVIGYASYEFGQVVKGQWNGGEIDHYWSHNVYAGIGFDASVGRNFSIISRVEGKMWNPYPAEDRRDWRQRGYALWLDQARGTYVFNPGAQEEQSLTAGYFVYKYNPEVRNLGEFLFRSCTYPGILLNSFDFPAQRILGFKYTLNTDILGGEFKNDFMAFEESELWPFGDISFAYVGSYSFMKKMVEIGGGVDFARAISVNSLFTTPTQDGKHNWQILGVDENSAPIYDSANYYTFKATKLMGRVTIDPKPALGNPNLFSSEDLKLYGEIGVIGVKDYPFWYEKAKDRMPMMFGFNVPTLKVLDLCAVEAEYYPMPFNTSYEKIVTYAIPQPNNEAGSYHADDYRMNHWRWSVYLKKQIIPGCNITVQFARDHSRLNYSDGLPTWEETLVNPGSMSWIVKFSGFL